MNPARKPLLCLDYDGVLSSYASGWLSADRCPDDPVPGAMQAIQAYTGTFRVAVYSSRTGQPGGLHAMSQWLRQHLVRELGAEEGVRVLDLIEWPHSKPPAMVTLDDRAIQFDGTWPSPDALAAFQPWNKRGPVDEQAVVQALSDAIDDQWDGGWDHDEELRESRGVVAGLASRGYRIVRAA